MQHAGPAALDRLDSLHGKLRALPGLEEKSRGGFYRCGKSFLHFHEDPAGLFADLGDARLRVKTPQEQAELLAVVTRLLDTEQ